jgi:hypothetical protein
MPTTDRKPRVVLSYAPEDKFIIQDFHRQFDAEGWIDLWLEEERIIPGMNREVEIRRAVENADAVIVFLSHNSVTKRGYPQRELKFALDVAEEKPERPNFIILLKLDQCQVPRNMRSLKCIDFSWPEDRQDAYSRLLKDLATQDDIVNRRTGKIKSAHFVSQKQVRTNLVSEDKVPQISRRKNKQVFISYSRNDIEFVKMLALNLETQGFSVWWDVSKLQGGDRWMRAIQSAIDASQSCIVVLTPDSVTSEWVENEYTYALANKVKVIPLYLRRCKVPIALATIQYIDFLKNEHDFALRHLIAAVKRHK